MNEILESIATHKIIPVVAIDNAKDAEPLASALIEGGLPCAEVTFRTNAAEEAIKKMVQVNTMLVGAGTVLQIEQVKKAVDAGAQFIVSPGFNSKIVDYCLNHNITVIPGISNPSDIEMGLQFDLEVLKFFPAEAFGGLKTLKAMAAPYQMIKFIPTGGIHEQNLVDYLSFSKVLACGGSWMVKTDLINRNQFKEITKLTREAISISQTIS